MAKKVQRAKRTRKANGGTSGQPGRSRFPTLSERGAELAAELARVAREAERDGATWAQFAAALQSIETGLRILRFEGNRVLLGKRPERLSFVARDAAKSLAAWADKLDDPATPDDERRRTTARVATLQGAVRGVVDEAHRRDVLCEIVQLVANWARKGHWRDLVSEAPPQRWLVLADEVIRIYGEVVDAGRVPRMRAQHLAIARAVEACSATYGRSKRATISKSQAIPAMCAALGFGEADLDSIGSSTRRRRLKKRQP